MSLGYRERVRRTTYIWDSLPEEEKKNIFEWCPISDEIIHEQYGHNADVDGIIGKMSDAEFQSFNNAVLKRYRARRAKKVATIRYLKQEGRDAQAKQLEEELKREDEEAQRAAEKEQEASC